MGCDTRVQPKQAGRPGLHVCTPTGLTIQSHIHTSTRFEIQTYRTSTPVAQCAFNVQDTLSSMQEDLYSAKLPGCTVWVVRSDRFPQMRGEKLQYTVHPGRATDTARGGHPVPHEG